MAIKKNTLAFPFSVNATIMSFPWPSDQKHQMKNRRKRIPGKNSQMDLSNRDRNRSNALSHCNSFDCSAVIRGGCTGFSEGNYSANIFQNLSL